MKATADVLKTEHLMLKLLHLKCLAHGLHNVADDIRNHFEKANKLIISYKNFFKNASKRKKILKEKCPSLTAVPSPIFTRWGTFLRAAEYYNKEDNRKELIKGTLIYKY